MHDHVNEPIAEESDNVVTRAVVKEKCASSDELNPSKSCESSAAGAGAAAAGAAAAGHVRPCYPTPVSNRLKSRLRTYNEPE